MGARLGIDAAALRFGEWACVLKTDPVTTAGSGAGALAVHVACNDLAAMGAEPLGVLPTLLFPPGVTVATIDGLVGEIDAAARGLNVEVLGGHTEVAPGVTAPLVVMAAVGRARPERLVTAAGARAGDALVLTKAAALEGTSILASDFADRLAAGVPTAMLAEARAYRGEVSVVPEGLLAAELGATAMHDPTEGGVLGALWEMAEASHTGFRVAEADIHLRPPTRLICQTLGVDPLRLIASGALLIACADGATMVSALTERGIEATVIGQMTAGPRELVHADGSTTIVETVARDELYRLIELAVGS